MLTENFSRKEFECPCCGECDMDRTFMIMLQTLRSTMDRPMGVTSGYRCERHNKTVGGVPKSRHLIGIGVDCTTLGWPAEDLYRLVKIAQAMGFKGIGIGKTYVHLDTREGRPKMWVY